MVSSRRYTIDKTKFIAFLAEKFLLLNSNTYPYCVWDRSASDCLRYLVFKCVILLLFDVEPPYTTSLNKYCFLTSSTYALTILSKCIMASLFHVTIFFFIRSFARISSHTSKKLAKSLNGIRQTQHLTEECESKYF